MKKTNTGIIIAVLLIGGSAMALGMFANNTSHATLSAQSAANNAIKPAPVDVYASRDNRAWGSVYLFNSQAKADEPVYQAMTQDTGGHIVNYNAVPPLEKDADYQKWHKLFGDDGSFSSTNGKEIYHQSCAGCHLHQGQGGAGAGYYPPLANNPKMHSSEYIYDILINGLRGMPYFRDMLNDEQMAAVTKYIQEDLNGIKSTVNAKDVAALRHESSPEIDPSDH